MRFEESAPDLFPDLLVRIPNRYIGLPFVLISIYARMPLHFPNRFPNEIKRKASHCSTRPARSRPRQLTPLHRSRKLGSTRHRRSIAAGPAAAASPPGFRPPKPPPPLSTRRRTPPLQPAAPPASPRPAPSSSDDVLPSELLLPKKLFLPNDLTSSHTDVVLCCPPATGICAHNLFGQMPEQTQPPQAAQLCGPGDGGGQADEHQGPAVLTRQGTSTRARQGAGRTDIRVCHACMMHVSSCRSMHTW